MVQLFEYKFVFVYVVEHFQLAVATGHTNNVTAACFSRMSKRKFILSVSHDCTLKLWSLAKLSEDEWYILCLREFILRIIV